MKKLCILGATGSIGTQTTDVIKREKSDFMLHSFSSNKNSAKSMELIEEFNPKYVAMMDEYAFKEVRDFCKEKKYKTEILFGIEGLNAIASMEEVDMVVTSVVGMVGLSPTMHAIRAGKDIALANKETLVVAGDLIMKEAKKHSVRILPVDSEHGAVFQCLQGNDRNTAANLLLTASGGPFRGRNTEELQEVAVEEALCHPKWNMGRKISVDSATLMNKGLEVIEAHWLFDFDYDSIKVIVHPQSIIHSMIEYIDGSVIAQLSNPDMRLPIQYALNYPERKASVIKKLNFFELNSLTFEKPDMDTFRCLKLAYEAGRTGGTMPAIMNAANEAAVALFLNRKISFLDIQRIIEKCMNKFVCTKEFNIDDVILLDSEIKEYVYKTIKV
ncbi:MAG: 1-deoxy-D-xylulose-5-phosphate reductoisomerase [Clostridiaceae bacterium]